MITREEVMEAFADTICAMPTEPGVEGCMTIDCIIISEKDGKVEGIPVDSFVLLFGGCPDLSAKSLHEIVDGQHLKGLPEVINRWQSEGYIP